MGVDYYVCDNCGETFPDCGDYRQCENGHYIGPCCFPKRSGFPEEQMTESDDYGDCVKTEYCPVCAKGGDDREQRDKALALIARLVKSIKERPDFTEWRCPILKEMDDLVSRRG